MTTTKTTPKKPPAPRGRAAGRRWPDLMIGALVLLLLGGFGTLLLRKDPAPAAVVAQTPPTIPSAPGSDLSTPDAEATAPVQPVPEAPESEAPAAAEPEPAPAPAPEAAAPASTPVTETPAPTPAPAETPAPAATQPTTTITPPVSVTPPAAEVPSAETLPETPAPAEPAVPSVPPRTGGAVATSESRVPLRSDYRISLGSFPSEAAVRSRTAAVAGLGYTVYPINVGSGFVAQVGPFADETAAREALTDIQRALPGALVYPPRGVSATQGSAAPSPVTPAAPATETTTPAPAPAATADTPTYLQVGAFDRVESAQALVQQLRDLGYDPNVNAPEGRKVTVSVGPYTGDALTRTESRLTENGLDHFRVR
ncbi:SPOR domain-containing protein [Deinococcus ficus]|uniref:SPOR domain-containing protein n=1 Tax=Deinococcus ficus TaxID=317577 RepID=UPI00174897A8|nr:SPOR domain-containing protein [Deinococcus ficus]GHF67621.1 hypothetical protein GCM10017782_01490 [Deinococcus ficus]